MKNESLSAKATPTPPPLPLHHPDDLNCDLHDHDALDWMLDNRALQCQFVPIAASQCS